MGTVSATITICSAIPALGRQKHSVESLSHIHMAPPDSIIWGYLSESFVPGDLGVDQLYLPDGHAVITT